MAGDEEMPQRLRAHGIRGHGGVAQPHHQRRAVGGQQSLQLAAQRPHRTVEKVRAALPEFRIIDGEIIPLRLAQRLRAAAVQNADFRDGIALPADGFCLDAGEL